VRHCVESAIGRAVGAVGIAGRRAVGAQAFLLDTMAGAVTMLVTRMNYVEECCCSASEW